jgi:hypothetical protein
MKVVGHQGTGIESRPIRLANFTGKAFEKAATIVITA